MSNRCYPDGSHVLSFLKGMNIKLPENAQFDDFVKETIRLWELETGWRPFLTDGKKSTRRLKVCCYRSRYSDEITGFVDLRGGLLKLHRVKDAHGVTLELDKDFRLMPEVPGLLIDGHQWLEIISGRMAHGDRIEVTGVWGACETIPEEVFVGMLKRIGAEVLTSMGFRENGLIQSWSEGGVSEKYGNAPYYQAIDRWRNQFRRLIRLYKRVEAV